MKYKLEDLMPVEGHPDDFSVYWVLDGDKGVFRKAHHNGVWWRSGDLVLTKILCYVPIPGAPDEVKPVAYPENVPSKRGKYIVHFPEYDEWAVRAWDRRKFEDWQWMTGNDIDYFINIPLNEPIENIEQLENKEKVNRIDMTPENIVEVKIFFGDGGITRNWKKGWIGFREDKIEIEKARAHLAQLEAQT